MLPSIAPSIREKVSRLPPASTTATLRREPVVSASATTRPTSSCALERVRGWDIERPYRSRGGARAGRSRTWEYRQVSQDAAFDRLAAVVLEDPSVVVGRAVQMARDPLRMEGGHPAQLKDSEPGF